MATGIGEAWLASTIAKLQMAAGIVLLERPAEACGSLEKLADDLPEAHTTAEARLLRGLLLEFATRWSMDVHGRAHHGQPACDFSRIHFLERLWSVDVGDSRVGFGNWVRIFVREFSRAHPLSAAARAAVIIRREFDTTLTVESLAERLRTSPERLRSEFHEEFGSSVPDYKRAVRVLEAIRQVSTEKIDAVATMVGYRSKKNFYRAFRKLTGLTPTDFRSLSPEAAAALIDAAWASRFVHKG